MENKQESTGNAGKIFWAIVGGVAAGAILGVLFAPDKGTETRKKITDSTKKFTDTVKESADAIRKTFGGTTEEVTNKVGQVGSEIGQRTRTTV